MREDENPLIALLGLLRGLTRVYCHLPTFGLCEGDKVGRGITLNVTPFHLLKASAATEIDGGINCGRCGLTPW